jgi:hypothetical protein
MLFLGQLAASSPWSFRGLNWRLPRYCYCYSPPGTSCPVASVGPHNIPMSHDSIFLILLITTSFRRVWLPFTCFVVVCLCVHVGQHAKQTCLQTNISSDSMLGMLIWIHHTVRYWVSSPTQLFCSRVAVSWFCHGTTGQQMFNVRADSCHY